ncbi:MAG: 5'/3'-nucleotidase SurE [Pleomorphochaeta sp.]
MNNEKPLILLVNDDGILSPGLAALCEAVSKFGELLIVAPDRQQTSMGRSYPRHDNLGVVEEVEIITKKGEFKGYSVNSSPAYAVAYAVKEISTKKPDLCISGINYGENLGKTLSYSGTIGAALQAADFDIPTLAISRPTELDIINNRDYAPLNWDIAKKVISFWTDKVLKEGIPFKAPIININVPENPENLYDYKYTNQSKKELFEFIKPKERVMNKPYKLPSLKRTNFDDIEKGSDIYSVCVENITSVTPIEGDFTFKSFLKEKNIFC